MNHLCLAAALVAAVVAPACQKGESAEDHARHDIERICNVERLSGADREESAARSVIAAEWLGRHIETQEGRDFLASLVPLPPAGKAARLREEAARAGLEDCPTAAVWEALVGGGDVSAPAAEPAPAPEAASAPESDQ